MPETRSRTANFHFAVAANPQGAKPSKSNGLSWISTSNLQISVPFNEKLDDLGERKPIAPSITMTYKKEPPKMPFGRIKSTSLIQKDFFVERSPTNSERFKLSSVSGGKDYWPGKASERHRTVMSFGTDRPQKNIEVLKQSLLLNSPNKKKTYFSRSQFPRQKS
jgi:hypothetical protein